MTDELKTPLNKCRGCARRDEIITELSEKNDEYRREVERLRKGEERAMLAALAV